MNPTQRTAADKIVGGSGVVHVGPIMITVTPLTMLEERSLLRQLRAAAEKEADYFTRCRKLLDAMKGHPAAYAEAVREITRLTATGPKVSDDQLYEFRNSPAGVACELFARGRKATPGLKPDELAAVITEANVDEVIESLTGIIEGTGPNAPTP